MNKKPILISFVLVFIFSIVFGYSLVFWVSAFFWIEVEVAFKLSNNIYPDSLYLRNTKIAFKTKEDLSEYIIKSGSCNIFSKLNLKEKDIYIFDLKILDNNCNDNVFYLENKNKERIFDFNFNIISEYRLYSELLDNETKKLEEVKWLLDQRKQTLLKYNEYKNLNISYNEFLKKNRLLNEVVYNSNIIKLILDWRNKKYLIPVKWKSLPTAEAKLPNSWRPYRSSYTDWIHHAWDFDWDFWEQVIAIDDWIIVRVVSDFNFSDLSRVNYWKNLTYDDKLKNLDILQWKQVWLKTMKWDVAFYSHLNDIFTNIKEWTVVRKWQPIWTIWKSWVPDKNYSDFHLHLPIQINPFDKNKIWKYEIEDYMRWNWLFKWKSKDYILENQNNVFEN